MRFTAGIYARNMDMSMQLVEVTRRVTAHYKGPDGQPADWTFHPDRVNRIPQETMAKIMTRKGSDGRPALAPYLDEGILTLIDEKRANAIVDGTEKLKSAQIDKAPAQEIAEAHAPPKPKSRSRKTS